MTEMQSELSRKDDVIRELQLRNQYLEGDRSFETKSLERDLLAKITVADRQVMTAFLFNFISINSV